MLKSTLYEQCSEQIHAYSYGDSLHIRYIILYTSFNRLIVLAENKYSIKKMIKFVEWVEEPIISMKFQTFELHILTLDGQYIQIVLGEVFSDNFILKDKMKKLKISTAPCLNYGLCKNQEIFKQFNDFLLGAKKVIFLTQSGTIIYYDIEKKVITLIIQLKLQLLQYQLFEIEKKECFVAITEFNDLVRFSDFEPEPQMHRFTDCNYQTKQMFFVGVGNILLLQESKNILKFQTRFVKYKLRKIKYVKKYYILPFDDINLKFLEIQELPKIFIALVFDQTKFKVVTLSKKVLQHHFSKEINLDILNLVDEQGNELNFQRIFNTPKTSVTSCLIFDHQILHLSKLNQSFQIKVTKSQIEQNLHSDSNILENQSEGNEYVNYQQNCCILISSTAIYLLRLNDQLHDQECNFQNLQQLENYNRTYNKYKITYTSWEQNIILCLWNKLNLEQGQSEYIEFKQSTDSYIFNWVESIIFQQSLYNQFHYFNLNQIKLTTQYQKCLATIALLNFKNLSNEISISIIISMVFNKSFEFSTQIINENSKQILAILQFMKHNPNPVLNYEYWKDSQQLLFLAINILDVWLTQVILQYDVEIQEQPKQFEPSFFSKIRNIIQSNIVPIELRLKLIILIQEQQYLKIFIMGIQQLKDKRNLAEFAQCCNPLTNTPTFNIKSIKSLLNDLDCLYLRNLIKLTSNIKLIQNIQLNDNYNEMGIIIMNLLTNTKIENEYYDIVEWFIS